MRRAQNAKLGLSTRLAVLQVCVFALAVGFGASLVVLRSGEGSRELRLRQLVEARSVAASQAFRRDVIHANSVALEMLVDGVRIGEGARYVAVVGGVLRAPVESGNPGVASRGAPDVIRVPVDSTQGVVIATLTIVAPSLSGRSEVAYLAIEVAEAAAGALIVAIFGTLAVTRWLRRRTFGLELDEVTDLIQEQQATLSGIREGVIGLDPDDKVRFANAEAQRLLHLPRRHLHRPISVLVSGGRLLQALSGDIVGKDLLVVSEDRVLVVNRMPVSLEERDLGHVVTLVDRTESESLLRELDGTLSLTEALRAQAHDFSNRIHTVIGLVELGEYSEAVRFATQLQVDDRDFAERVGSGVSDPVLGALLVAKSAVAREQGVELRIGESTLLEGRVAEALDLVTVVGNLIDNAIDAAKGSNPAWVEVSVEMVSVDLIIKVADSGPGVAEGDRDAIFVDGFTTKSSHTGARRGLGLAVLRQLVYKRAGQVDVGIDTRSGGAVFTVRLPAALEFDSQHPGVSRDPGCEGLRPLGEENAGDITNCVVWHGDEAAVRAR